MNKCRCVGQLWRIARKGLGILLLHGQAHFIDGLRRVIEHVMALLDRFPLEWMHFIANRAAMVADARMQQANPVLAPCIHSFQWPGCQEPVCPRCSGTCSGNQSPAFGTMPTGLAVPLRRWWLVGMAPVFALKACIGLTKIVQKGQNGQACNVNFREFAASGLLRRALYARQLQQPIHDGCYIRHVVDQAVCLNSAICSAL
ncbi:MAG TPA: hypothetical protein DEF75_05890 [Comamonas kerstersii]|nr:hypothetical protein [Comamonas kerstersii]